MVHLQDATTTTELAGTLLMRMAPIQSEMECAYRMTASEDLSVCVRTLYIQRLECEQGAALSCEFMSYSVVVIEQMFGCGCAPDFDSKSVDFDTFRQEHLFPK